MPKVLAPINDTALNAGKTVTIKAALVMKDDAKKEKEPAPQFVCDLSLKEWTVKAKGQQDETDFHGASNFLSVLAWTAFVAVHLKVVYCCWSILNVMLKSSTQTHDSQMEPKVPIILGVVGHLILPEDQRLRKEIEASVLRVFHDFKQRFPNSPLIILSCLAQGADQLVAKLAIEEGYTVHAPLPFPPQVYAASSSFDQSEEGRAAANQLLKWTTDPNSPVSWFVTPLPGGPAVNDVAAWENLRDDPSKTPRHTCYTNAGSYIVHRCHALIAIWDKEKSGGEGGTYELVSFKLTGHPPILYPWPRPDGYREEVGPVFAIHSPRDISVTNNIGTLSVLLPSPAQNWQEQSEYLLKYRESAEIALFHRLREGIGWKASHDGGSIPHGWSQFRATCRAVEGFNRDINVHWKTIEGRVTMALERTLGKGAEICHSDETGALKQTMEPLVKVREAAAGLSTILSKKLEFLQGTMFSFAFLSVFFFHLYTHYFSLSKGHPEHQPLWLFLSLCCLLMSGMVVSYVWMIRLDERRLDYRVLAEILRVKCWWGMAGIGASVADSYPAPIRSELDWVRKALISLAPLKTKWIEIWGRKKDDAKLDCLQKVCNVWVYEQCKYFQDRRHSHHRKALLYRRWGAGAAIIGWVLGLLLLIPNSYFNAHEPAPLLIVTIGTVVAAGGLLIAYCERQSHEELAKHYDRMANVFADGLQELNGILSNTPVDTEAAQRVIVHLGHQAIVEHSQWLLLRRARPFEPLIH